MAKITVSPETFELIDFDAAEITAVASSVADAVGLDPDVEVRILVDEAVILAKTATRVEAGADGAAPTIVVEATGGAFESLRITRTFDADRCRNVLGQALLRARDRLDPSFGEAPADNDLDVYQETAWAAYVEGRLVRMGVTPGRLQRRIYHFRVRHGFNDRVDQVFDRLWNGDGLIWRDIQAASDEARGAAVTA